MITMRIATFIAAAGLLASPALAGDPLPSPTASTPARADDKMVCKRQAQTGTRFAKKICYTVAQWDAMAEADRRMLAETIGATAQRESGRN
jgi:hypothetical protein